MYEFRLRAFTPAGVPLGETVRFLDLACSAEVNAPGFLLVRVSSDWTTLPDLSNNSRIFLDWRDIDLGMEWTSFFQGLLRMEESNIGAGSTVDLGAVGLNWLLNTRVNAYPADVENFTAWTVGSIPAETVMKGLITKNMTGAAHTGNGRLRNGTAWPATSVTIGAGSGRGLVVSPWFNAHVKLLPEMQKLASIGGGDFDFNFSGADYRFQFYPGQRGTDRSADVIFGVEFGNMGDVSFLNDRRNEATAAIVGGQGEKAERDFVTVLGPDYSADNDIEVFVPATDVPFGSTAGLTARGKEKLFEYRAVWQYNFKLLQTKKTRLGRDYFLGDKVGVINPRTLQKTTMKVVVTEITFDSDGNSQVSVIASIPAA